MRVIALTAEAPDEQVASLMGTFLDSSHYDTLITDDCTVLKPNGEILLVFKRRAVSSSAAKAAWSSLRRVPLIGGNANRGMAAGIPTKENIATNSPVVRSVGSKLRIQEIKRDGTLSKTLRAAVTPSGIVGFFDRTARQPYCRQTAFVGKSAQKWTQALPFIRAVDRVFAELMPERYAAQRAIADATAPDFVITGTAFTTVTVNRNWQTAVHTDKGDLPDGFGVITATRAGNYDGGYLVFPKYRVAVDIQSCDVLLCDVHEAHGNTPFFNTQPGWERISFVLYYRKNMIHCGSAAEELERVKNRKPGDKIYD